MQNKNSIFTKTSKHFSKQFILKTVLFSLFIIIALRVNSIAALSDWADFASQYGGAADGFIFEFDSQTSYIRNSLLSDNPSWSNVSIKGISSAPSILDGGFNYQSQSGQEGAGFSFNHKTVIFDNMVLKNFYSRNDAPPYGYSSAGGIFADYSSISFTGSHISFENNTLSFIGDLISGGAHSFASAFYINNSTSFFSADLIDFNNNGLILENSGVDAEGGTFYAKNSYIYFQRQGEGRISFSSNSIIAEKTAVGGALYLYESFANFDNENILLKNNLTSHTNRGYSRGGAVYLFESSIVFNAGGISFTSNIASGLNTDNIDSIGKAAGGALYIENSIALFDGLISVFENNIAEIRNEHTHPVYGGGGALYLKNARAVFSNGYSDWKGNGTFFINSENGVNNSTLYGGAIAALDGSFISIDNPYFTSNTASSFGGAVYLENSTISINSSLRDVFFTGNSAGAEANDIFLKDGSFLYLNAVKDIILSGGIQAGTDDNFAVKTGRGNLFFTSASIVKYNSNFIFKEGAAYINAPSVKIGKVFLEGAKLSLAGGIFEKNILYSDDIFFVGRSA
jgi:hypothetical protein